MSKLTYSGTKYLYAVLGTSELMLEKAKELGQTAGRVADQRRKDLVKFYDEAAKRGEKLTGKVKSSQPGKRLVENAKQAQRQIKGAATSVRKAVKVEEPKTSTKKAS